MDRVGFAAKITWNHYNILMVQDSGSVAGLFECQWVCETIGTIIIIPEVFMQYYIFELFHY